ncbi:peptidyl-prolyl cis-trans isomerase B (cyclophilin B) [Sulfurivirga caldicuralii]|uniref:Peptidyl-prolyl cis-trans isomerase n=1 Tax=Sulfurivirga caldicuralii TaxID=364032 RepID=A0A1N6F4P2_9GAMM|nr:peptidylprolyl isomerase [Sulfurivirga caldicuralii]SIN90231.1 peptidyl-prolyl cis-trans isomerase B (cyclophilin B) [Sulfurivirga caldicuralii]
MSNPKVIFHTNKGDITIELYPEKAPKTVENFLRYAKEGFYNGTIFHRVIPGFVIQGGGHTPDMDRKPTHEPIENEADNGLKNEKYTLSMARTMDPHSATSQFFINLNDNAFLDFRSKDMDGWGYAVFGKVVDGTDTVDAIARVPTGNYAGHQDVPMEPIIIESTDVIEGDMAE